MRTKKRLHLHLLIFVQGLLQSLAEEVIPLGIEEDKPIFQHARKRALSGQQIQAEKLMRQRNYFLSQRLKKTLNKY
jgi:hypothetical protein